MWIELFKCVQEKPEKKHLMQCVRYLMTGAKRNRLCLLAFNPLPVLYCVYTYIYQSISLLCLVYLSFRLWSLCMTKVAAAIWYHYECVFFLSWYENGGKWSRAGLMFMEELSVLGEYDKPKGEKVLDNSADLSGKNLLMQKKKRGNFWVLLLPKKPSQAKHRLWLWKKSPFIKSNR